MAVVQKNGILSLDDSTGTLQVMSGVVQMTADVENTTGEYAVLPTKWVNTMDGRRRFRGSFRGIAETGAAANQLRDTCRAWLLSATKPGARSFKIESPDDQPGSEEWTGEIRIGGMTPMVDANAEDDGALVTTINFVGDGAISFAVIV